jgi:hypothetical protein
MAKKGFNIRLDEEILTDIEKVANAAGMDRNDYAALWLRVILRGFWIHEKKRNITS